MPYLECVFIGSALVLFLRLSSERTRILDRFIEAVQQGTLAVSLMSGNQVAGAFPGHSFRIHSSMNDRGRRLYALELKPFIDSVRVGPFAFYGKRPIPGYAKPTQELLGEQFNRILAQTRRVVPDPDLEEGMWP